MDNMRRARAHSIFIKISEDQFIDSLQKEGKIYCNHIRYFRSIEDNELRGDPNEGKAYIEQVKNMSILVDEKVVATAESAQLYFEGKEDYGNIFCLYGYETSLIDKTKMTRQHVAIANGTKNFGKNALLICDTVEFRNRVETALKGLLKDFRFQPVNYYDHTTYQGELNPFCKSNKYKDQNEVRLWISNEKEEPFEFFIGDISDISYKIPVSDLNKISIQYQK